MSKLPAAPKIEVRRNSSIETLAPKFADAVRAILADLEAAGKPGRLFETLRDDSRQQYLHGFGRLYDDGRGIVTHSETADDTWHGFGLAADIISQKGNWNDPEFFALLMKLAAKHGCLSGADWNRNGSANDERFQDWPHIQFGTLRRSPSPNAARLVNQLGLTGMWSHVGAA